MAFTYVIQDDDENGCYIFDTTGRAMETHQMICLARRLIATAKGNGVKQYISEYNRKLDEGIHSIECNRKPKPKKTAYVYMLKCCGKYKIGCTHDIERRVAELDDRPFPVEVVALSCATTEAFKEERIIHSKLSHLKISGEWYEISDDGAERLKKYIGGIGENG